MSTYLAFVQQGMGYSLCNVHSLPGAVGQVDICYVVHWVFASLLLHLLATLPPLG